jgi:phosphonate transport system substrate-binding protein
MRRIAALFAVCLLALAAVRAAAGEADAAGGPLVLAVHPYLPAAELTSRFTPLAEALARALGRPVAVRVGRSYAEHVEAIGSDAVDLAYLGPATYVTMVSRYGAKPLLARQVIGGDPMLHGEIIVREESALRSLQELRDKRFAFGDPESTMSSVVPLAVLRAAGVPQSALGQAVFLGAHRNVALAVLAGDADAGAVREDVFVEYAARGLRVLAHQPGVADRLFVASARLPAPDVDTLRRTFLALPESPAGRAVMASLDPAMTALVLARDSDYDNLRALMQLPPGGARPHR